MMQVDWSADGLRASIGFDQQRCTIIFTPDPGEDDSANQHAVSRRPFKK
jgi:hypothetical protein